MCVYMCVSSEFRPVSVDHGAGVCVSFGMGGRWGCLSMERERWRARGREMEREMEREDVS